MNITILEALQISEKLNETMSVGLLDGRKVSVIFWIFSLEFPEI